MQENFSAQLYKANAAGCKIDVKGNYLAVMPLIASEASLILGDSTFSL
jgi:hypothetical protein